MASPTKRYSAHALEQLCRNYQILAHAQIGVPADLRVLNDTRALSWMVTLIFGKRTVTVPYFTARGENSPSPASVLFYLLTSAKIVEQSSNVMDWAQLMALDPKKPSTQALYKHHVGLLPQLRTFLGISYEAFQDALS